MEQLSFKREDFSQEAICEKHGAFTQKGIKIRAGGNIIWHKCSRCEDESVAAQEQARLEQEKIRAAARLQDMLGRSCLPKRFIGKTFEAFNAKTNEQKHAFDVCFNYANNFHTHANNGTGLIFLGRPGTGKSHLAASIIQKIMPEYFGLYATVADCIGRLGTHGVEIPTCQRSKF